MPEVESKQVKRIVLERDIAKLSAKISKTNLIGKCFTLVRELGYDTTYGLSNIVVASEYRDGNIVINYGAGAERGLTVSDYGSVVFSANDHKTKGVIDIFKPMVFDSISVALYQVSKYLPGEWEKQIERLFTGMTYNGKAISLIDASREDLDNVKKNFGIEY